MYKEHISITDEEFEFCKTLFIPKKLRKSQYLLQEGDVSRYTSFVEKGMLRTFTVDEKGNEPILQFSMEGWWVTDLYSFLTDEPSRYNIEALEDCELLLITKPSWDILLEKVPAFERYFRILIQNNLIAMQRRLISSMTETCRRTVYKINGRFPHVSSKSAATHDCFFFGDNAGNIKPYPQPDGSKKSRSKMKVFITRKIPDVGLKKIMDAGIEVIEWNEKRPLSQPELIEYSKQCDALLSAGFNNIDAHFLNECKHLKVISLHSVGYDNVDIAAANALKIPVGHTPGVLSGPTADVAFMLMLAVSRKAFYLHNKIMKGEWLIL